MFSEKIRIDSGYIVKDHFEVVHVVYTENTKINLKSAKETLLVLDTFFSNNPGVMIVHAKKPVTISKSARIIFSQYKNIIAVAAISKGVTRIIGNLFKYFLPTSFEVFVIESLNEAYKALAPYQPAIDLNHITALLDKFTDQENNLSKKQRDPRISAILDVLFQFSGQNFQAKLKVEKVRDGIDEIMAGINMIGDEIERSHKAVKTSEKRMQLIMEHINDGFWDWELTPAGQGTENEYLSPSFKKMFGYEDHELENKTSAWMNKIHPDDLKVAIEQFKKHIQSEAKEPYWCEVRYRHKDGGTVWVICRGVALRDEETGIWTRMVGTHTDITELKKAQNELKEQQAQLVQTAKMVSLGEMSSGMAHEINNPLFVADGNLDLIRSRISKKFPQALELITPVLDNVGQGLERIRSIVDHMREYSRISSFNPENVTIETLLNFSLQLVRQQLIGHDVEIDVISETVDMEKVRVDKIKFEQVAVNLLLNARDAIMAKRLSGDHGGRIEIIATSQGNKINISFSDDGVGMSPETQAKAFDAFFTTKDPGKGTGLGLSVSIGIIREFHGDISNRSKPGHGTSFDILLPKAADR